MKSSFDQQLKQKLEHSSPEELGYPFDPEQLWNKMGIPPRQKKPVYKLWYTHAAALAAGLITGALLLALLQEGQPEAITHTVYVRDTVRIATTVATAAPEPEAIREAGKKMPPLPVKPVTRGPAGLQKEQGETGNLTAAQPQTAEQVQEPALPETLPATNEPYQAPRKKVIHLADLRNENNPLQGGPARMPEMLWTKILPKAYHTEENPETFSVLFTQQLKHRK